MYVMTKGIALRTLLRESTHDQHTHLSKHPLLATIMQPNYALSDYHKLLSAYFGLYHLVEARIQRYLGNETVNFAYNERYKLPWLMKDLTFFQIEPIVLNNLSPTVRDFPAISSLGQLIGLLYVLEGSTLGASQMALKLAESHSLTPEAGCCFFSGYGHNTLRYWQDFIVFSDTLSGDDLQCQEALRTARQTFQLFGDILDQSLSPHFTTTA